MLPRKKNDAHLSVPPSRVASSQRLNQLSNSSRPDSPSYVSSLLNPSGNLPITPTNTDTNNTNPGFDDVPIVSLVSQFEQELDVFTAGMLSFKGGELAESMAKLVHTNETLRAELNSLKVHQELGVKIERLEQQNRELDTKAKSMLRELILCRAELRKMPRASVTGDATKNATKNVDVKEALKYAMKLAKFTRAPPMVGNAQFHIHPNNFIWPAEDSLRRGMLALTSLKPDEVIAQELGAEVAAGENDAKEEEVEMEAPPQLEGVNDQAEAAPLKLDLFDSDEDYD